MTNTSGESYAYDYRGKRIVKWLADGSAEIYVYGIDGKKLTTLNCYANLITCFGPQYNVYFKGKLVISKGIPVVTDRTGSVRWNQGSGMPMYSSYYPYGEERTPTTADDREKFGTYTRDNPGQDYADQRYYGVGTGRFLSADPGGVNTADPSTSLGWNRYAYVQGDPVNFRDPQGLDLQGDGDCTWDEDTNTLTCDGGSDPCDEDPTMIGCGGGGDGGDDDDDSTDPCTNSSATFARQQRALIRRQWVVPAPAWSHRHQLFLYQSLQ